MRWRVHFDTHDINKGRTCFCEDGIFMYCVAFPSVGHLEGERKQTLTRAERDSYSRTREMDINSGQQTGGHGSVGIC